MTESAWSSESACRKGSRLRRGRFPLCPRSATVIKYHDTNATECRKKRGWVVREIKHGTYTKNPTTDPNPSISAAHALPAA